MVNDSTFVSSELRARVTAAIASLDYAPLSAARNLKKGRSQLIALVVSDLANPFFARVVHAAEAAAAAWGYALVIFNSDEKPENERRILARIRALSCDGILLVPVDARASAEQRDSDGSATPLVQFGRVAHGGRSDSVTIDNEAAGCAVTDYLLDLGHRLVGTITGPLHLTTGKGRLEGLRRAMVARGLAPRSEHVRSGEFREDVAYSVAREMLNGPNRPTALYAASGVMALGVLRALVDLGLQCPDDISIASTDTIPGIGALRPRLTRTEHPVAEMVNESLRLLTDRIARPSPDAPRHVVFQPSLILGDSCRPVRESAEVERG